MSFEVLGVGIRDILGFHALEFLFLVSREQGCAGFKVRIERQWRGKWCWERVFFVPDKLLALELGKGWVVNQACGPAWRARIGLKPW